MKIGIMTHFLHFGYGGVLQNFALQKVLKSLGYDPVTLRVAPIRKKSYYKVLRDGLSRIIHYLLRRDVGITMKQDIYVSRNIEPFIQEYIKTTAYCASKKDFRIAVEQEQCKVLIAGSDQIWRASYDYVEECYFDFAADMNIKRIAYAASLAVDNWEYTSKQTRYIRPLVKKFDAVSVRELSGIDLCKNYLGVDAELVLDPTLLLEKEEYIQLVKYANEKINEGELFTYILDKTKHKESIIEEIARNTGFRRYECMPKYKTKYAEVKRYAEECVYPSITKWIRSIMDAKLIVTDSFHGMVFSIIFNKPFFVLINIDRGSARFTSLLKLFNLEDRIIYDINSLNLKKTIDWDYVNTMKRVWKEKSIKFLSTALN